MLLPSDVTTWTYDTVLDVVRNHEYEPGQFDYKGSLNSDGDKAGKSELRDSIRKTACSMANTDGGFILFGILDRKHHVSTSEERIKGIPLNSDLLRDFGHKLTGIQPELHFVATPTSIPLPDAPDRGVFVVYIPRSPRRPHMDERTHIFYRRGDGGAAVEMGYHEVLEQMLYTEERMQKIAFFRLYVRHYRTIIGEFLRLGTDELPRALSRFDTAAFMPLLADVCGLIPQSLHPRLLHIHLRATRFNRELDKAGEVTMHNGTPPENAGIVLHNVLLDFDMDCEFVDQELDRIFGQLGGLMRMPT